MTATLEDVRVGIGTNLKAIPGMQVQPYLLANMTPPSAIVTRGPVEYHQAMSDGLNHWTMSVRVFVANVSDIGAQKLLDEYLSVDEPRSVKAAIESDPTLGGSIDDLIVTGATGEGEFVGDQGGPLLFSEWTVEVWL